MQNLPVVYHAGLWNIAGLSYTIELKLSSLFTANKAKIASLLLP
jgi:hypothetical protein